MSDLIHTFTALEQAFNQAMIFNDPDRSAAGTSDDWQLITPEAGPVSRAAMLAAIGTGVLSHDTMTQQILAVRHYGDVVLVVGRGQNTGHFRGAPMDADEWITDVCHDTAGRWLCVLTHLTPAPFPNGPASGTVPT